MNRRDSDSFNMELLLAAKKHGVRVDKDTIVYRRKRYIGIIGTLLIILATISFFLENIVGVIISVLLLGTPGLLFLLSYFFAKVCMNDKEIVYRNLFGYKTHILWKEAKRESNRYNWIVYSKDKRIRIGYGFAGFESMNRVIEDKRENAKLTQ